MDGDMTFSYNYSAKENKEIEDIRKKYLPRSESNLDELKRLDRRVQTAGMTESLSVGIIGCLCFGLGMCMAMKVIAGGLVMGILLGIIGVSVMLLAYPVFRRISEKMKNELTPRILELADRLSAGS